jgi:hypothetical protein
LLAEQCQLPVLIIKGLAVAAAGDLGKCKVISILEVDEFVCLCICIRVFEWKLTLLD